MCSSPVSTASSFDAQLLQQTFDYAIEETCRSFGLLSPFQNTQEREAAGRTGDGVSPNLAETSPAPESPELLRAEQSYGMTYEGAISKEGVKKFPKSYYHVQEMNKGPVDYTPRLAQVPSQYQLEFLTEMYVCDYPKPYRSVKREGEEMELDGIPAHAISRSVYVPFLTTSGSRCDPIGADLHEIRSEYVSEMLY